MKRKGNGVFHVLRAGNSWCVKEEGVRRATLAHLYRWPMWRSAKMLADHVGGAAYLHRKDGRIQARYEGKG